MLTYDLTILHFQSRLDSVTAVSRDLHLTKATVAEELSLFANEIGEFVSTLLHQAVFLESLLQLMGQLQENDIIVPPGTQHEAALVFGQNYLVEVGIEDGKGTAEQCRFCHVGQATSEMKQAIDQKGYFIVAMEGCPLVSVN